MSIERTHGGRLLPALAALGSCACLAGPASALELGELRVDSHLGQPLRASIAYALGPGELLRTSCISLGGASMPGLPAVSGAQLAVTGNTIRIMGSAPVADPLLSLSVSIACPRTARLVREYAVLVDPPGRGNVADAPMVAREPSGERSPARPAPRQAGSSSAGPSAAAAPGARAPLDPRAAYRVQRGDTLSGIVARIPDRRLSLRQSADAISAANPQAFSGGDPNRLRAGALLAIPETLYAGSAAGLTAADPPPAATPDPAASESISPTTPEAVAHAPAAPEPMAQSATTPGSAAQATAEPGDVTEQTTVSVVTADPAANAGDAVTPAAAAEPAGDALTRTAAETANAPEGLVRGLQSPAGDSRASLVWLGGGGLLLMLGLLLFGRRMSGRFGAAAGMFGRRASYTEAFADADEEEDTMPALETLDVNVDRTGGIEVSYSDLSVPDDIDAALAAPDEDGCRILEQDYEDELTATQALNLQLERAAREMSLDLTADEEEAVSGDRTLELERGEAAEAKEEKETDVNETLAGDLADAENDSSASLELDLELETELTESSRLKASWR